MKIAEKIAAKNGSIYGEKPITIAFTGDSVTQGCFEVYYKNDGNLETVFDRENSFPTKLQSILSRLFPAAQVNIINSGISGSNAMGGNDRFERDIAPYSPDLVVVGYALNDCFGGENGLQRYTDALKSIFGKIHSLGAEAILLTPNLLCDRVSPHIADERIRKLAENFSEKGDILDAYVKAAIKTAEECSVPVCDVYSKWKRMNALGIDTTELLANKLNHPIREMNELTAMMLADMIIVL